MSDFEKALHNMFDCIWDCEIEHPIFQDTVGDLMHAFLEAYKLQKEEPRKLSNREWKEFLAKQFGISKTSAKEMLHGMMRWKKEDNFKRTFNPIKEQDDD